MPRLTEAEKSVNPDYILNPKSKRWVQRKGAIGQKILRKKENVISRRKSINRQIIDKRVSKAEKELETSKVNMNKAKSDLLSAQIKLKGHKTRKQQLKKDNNSLRKSIISRNQIIKRLTLELSNVTSSKNSKSIKMRAKITKLKSEIISEKSTIKKLEYSLSKKTNELADAHDRLEQATTIENNLKHIVETEDRKRVEWQRRAQEEKQYNTRLSKQLKDEKDNVKSLADDLQNVIGQLSMCQQNRENFKGERNILHNTGLNLQRRLQLQNQEIQRLLKQQADYQRLNTILIEQNKSKYKTIRRK